MPVVYRMRRRVQGIGDIPTGPTTINILTGAPLSPGTTPVAAGQVAAVSPGGTGTGASGYTINSDGSVTWFDALGNPITNVGAYNAAVNFGDTGAAALNLPGSSASSSGVVVGIIGVIFVALFALAVKH